MHEDKQSTHQLYQEERLTLRDFVLFSQDFVREAKIDRVSLSIRGIHVHSVGTYFNFG